MADQQTGVAHGEVPDSSKARTPLHKKITLSLSAFVMSVTITLINAYYGLRGSDIVVQPPKQLMLYRDGEGERAVLNFAVRLPMINTASGYGDLLLNAELVPVPGGPHLDYQALVQPVFVDDSAAAAQKCDLETRCISLPGLLVAEHSDEILDIPGGAARSRYFAFTAAEWSCRGEAASCKRFGNFNAALAQLAGKPLDVTIELKFDGDGKRRIRCRGPRVDGKYLAQVGWMNLDCKESSVDGKGFL